MDTTRMTRRRQHMHQHSTELRLERTLDALKMAEYELNQTGDTESRVLDIAMQDLANCMRRCAAVIRDRRAER